MAKRRPPSVDLGGYALGRTLEASWERSLRNDNGIFYTSEILATFLATRALEDLATDRELKVLDPACGAGAFLLAVDQAHDRRLSLFGSDLLAQAVEVAELALSIRSDRNTTRVTSFAVGDSLDIEGLFERLGQRPSSFDLVIGNPPWGARCSESQRIHAGRALGLPLDKSLDSWEVFVALALHALRPGGRLALVLPDTLFGPDKASTRKLLVEHTQIEALHNLGPDWFGTDVRMGAVVVMARRGAPLPDSCYRAMLLHGDLRRRAIDGELSLAQLEARLARRIPQARSLASRDFALEVFRDEHDDVLMQRMDAAAVSLATICTRGRGEEMAKSGLLWKCTGCDALNNPGTKAKAGGFRPTACKQCGRMLTDATADSIFLVSSSMPDPARIVAPFIDGDDLPGRYKPATASRWLALDTGFKLKSATLYVGPKILVRQAGVGVAATLDDSDARCPQSVYLYRVNPEHEGWTNEYVLAVLLSRAMAYYVFKRFSEVDPARAHAKLTHERLASLPIPRVDLGDVRQATLLRQIHADVRSLLAASVPLGGEVDWRIEAAVRDLYGLDAEDGAHIDRELQSLPRSQAIAELFPDAQP